MKCITCIYGATCGQPTRERDNCLPTYKHYIEGKPRIRLWKLQQSGEINIVLGNSGEHEVNPKWSIEKARAQLSDRCENVGGLSWRKGDSIFVDKPYDAGYELQYEGGKLMRIFRETRQIPRTLWWSRDKVVETSGRGA